MNLDRKEIYFEKFTTTKICWYRDLIISYKAVCTLLRHNWSHISLVKIKCLYWNPSVPRGGSKPAVYCGETSQRLVLLFVGGSFQLPVVPPLSVVPPHFKFLLSCQYHLYHYLIIIRKPWKCNFVAKTMIVFEQMFLSSLFSHVQYSYLFKITSSSCSLAFWISASVVTCCMRFYLSVNLKKVNFDQKQTWS